MTWAVLLVAMAAATQQAWPAHARETGRVAPHPVAVVNGVTLRSDRLEAAVNALLPLESFHQNVNADRVAALRRQALDRIVDEEIQFQDAVKRGVVASGAEVDAALSDTVKRYPSRPAFDAALARSGASLAELRKELRRRLVIDKGYEQQVSSKCGIDRAEAQRYFAKHPDRFVEPEQLRIHAITIGVKPSGSEADWSSARTRAEDVRRQLAHGADFEDLAKRFSTDPSGPKGGDMGLVHRGSLSQDFETATASLAAGEISPVVETIYGFHLIRVTAILPPRARSFADVGDRLQADLSAERCVAARETWIKGLRAAAAIEYPR